MPKRSEEKSKVLKSNSYELKPFTTNQLTSECEYFIHSKPAHLLAFYKWCLYKSKDSTGQATFYIMTRAGYVFFFYLSTEIVYNTWILSLSVCGTSGTASLVVTFSLTHSLSQVIYQN